MQICLARGGSHGNDLFTLTYFDQAAPGTTFDDPSSRQPFPYLSDTSQQTSKWGLFKLCRTATQVLAPPVSRPESPGVLCIQPFPG
jgi:hypothetical protein